MIVTERRFDVKLISADGLKNYMAFHGYSVRTLAAKVGVSHASIGHLTSGARNTCKPEVARKIARVLNCPVEALFMPRVSTVQREVGPRGRAA